MMMHLKELIKDIEEIKEDLKVNNLSELLNFIKSKHTLNNKYVYEDGAIYDSYFLKMIEDCNFNEYIIESSEFVGTFIDSEELKINEESDYLFLYDENITFMIPIKKFKEHYKIYIDELICVSEYILQKCDGCSQVSLKQLLFNLYPEINTGLNEKYKDYRGMVCSGCLERMEKGLDLKNDEVEDSNKSGNVDEKIDEFSSIEDILKFCGLDNKDELQKALQKKIYNCGGK